MENLIIETLFESISRSKEYNDMPEMSEANKIAHKSDAELEELLGDLFRDADNLIVRQIGAYERGAFIVGFKTAMRLVLECCSLSLPEGGGIL